MDFGPELRAEVAGGEITVSYRLWRRAKVRVGGQYRVEDATIEVDRVELVPFSSVTPGDVRRSGETSRGALRRRAAHSGPIGDGTLVYPIEFHVVDGEVAR